MLKAFFRFKFTILLCLPLLFLSCGKGLGYGILLWSSDESVITSGTSVRVMEESVVRESFTIRPEEGKDKIEVPQWRVKMFEEPEERDQALADYAPWANFYARCERRGLPMRSAPETAGDNTVYKLRDGQEVKVLFRQPEKVTIGNLEGYWYELLTEDGVTGWCFDYYLQVYSVGEDNQVVMENQQTATDALLEQLMDTPFYPDYFSEMVSQRRVDLVSMNPEYRFYIDSTNKTISFKSREREVTEQYESAEMTAFHTYGFIGSSFTLEAYNENIISLQYSYEGKDYKDGMVRLSRPLEEILQAERERRQNLEQEFIDKGPSYVSDTYGELQFMEGGRFYWKDKSILISRSILSSQAGNDGIFRFNRFPDSSLRSSYDGAVNLRFQNGEVLNMLYTWRDNGLRLLYIPENNVDKTVIISDKYLNPIQIFFRFNPEEG